jgi:hypothetical protein
MRATIGSGSTKDEFKPCGTEDDVGGVLSEMRSGLRIMGVTKSW